MKIGINTQINMMYRDICNVVNQYQIPVSAKKLIVEKVFGELTVYENQMIMTEQAEMQKEEQKENDVVGNVSDKDINDTDGFIV